MTSGKHWMNEEIDRLHVRTRVFCVHCNLLVTLRSVVLLTHYTADLQ